MDRDRIERNDFSTARRGYDRDEVLAHLRGVAEEVERLRQDQERSRGLADEVERLRQEQHGWGLAGSAAKQIREIVGAAERAAAVIRQGAEDDAQESRRKEEVHRAEVRKRAEAVASEHVARVEQASERVLQQVGAAGSELEQMLDGLRREAGQLMDAITWNLESVQAELRQIQGGVPPVRGTPGSAEPAAASAHVAATAEGARVEDDAAPAPEVDVVDEEDKELPAGEGSRPRP
jgi:cell division septum initiation protein DivIVA